MTARIEALLGPALDARPFWVKAELASANERRGTLFCDLVETRNGSVVARVRCHVWGTDLAAIRRRFEKKGVGLMLDDGTEVGIKCKVEYHSIHGLALRGLDMDPEVALGELERRRREMLERLAEDGLLDKNQTRPAPLVPRRIGLVASRDTAGYQDFVHTLQSCAIGVEILLADAHVQGEETERSVLRALDCLAALDVDIVAIIRGGGSRVDLSYLDNEAIARRVADFAVQVWTGIGHETDRSVLDEVAARSLKTPTAVAEEIRDQLITFERRLREAAGRIGVACRLRIEPERTRVETAAKLIARGAVSYLRSRRAYFEAIAGRVRDGARGRLAAERSRLQGATRQFQTAPSGHLKLAARVLEERHKSLSKTVVRLLEQKRLFLQRSSDQMFRASDYGLRSRRSTLNQQRSRFRRQRYQQHLERAAESHRQWQRALCAADPELALERGYSMTFSANGTLMKSVAEVDPGERIRTRLRDGSVLSTVESTEETK